MITEGNTGLIIVSIYRSVFIANLQRTVHLLTMRYHYSGGAEQTYDKTKRNTWGVLEVLENWPGSRAC